MRNGFGGYFGLADPDEVREYHESLARKARAGEEKGIFCGAVLNQIKKYLSRS